LLTFPCSRSCWFCFFVIIERLLLRFVFIELRLLANNTEKILSQIDLVSKLSQQNINSTEEIKNLTEQVNRLAKDLNNKLNRFKT